MRRWFPSVVAFGFALQLLSVPCRALMTAPQAPAHDCCGEKGAPTAPAAPESCQTRCAAAQQDAVLPVAIAAPDLAVQFVGVVALAERLSAAPSANSAVASRDLAFHDLYLQNSCLLI